MYTRAVGKCAASFRSPLPWKKSPAPEEPPDVQGFVHEVVREA